MGWFKQFLGLEASELDSLALLGTDLHSHLIPGLDDGAKTIEESIELGKRLTEMGYRKIITTPHVMADYYPNSREQILSGLELLRKAFASAAVLLEVEAAAEYYLDEGFEAMLGKADLLTFGGSKNYLLFETSLVNQPMSLENLIFKCRTLGFTPVMAHPERYAYNWKRKIEDFEIWRDMGLHFQVNLSSFAGNSGERARKIAEMFAKQGYIDFVGTDLHRLSQIDGIERALKTSKVLKNLLNSGALKNSEI